MNAEVFRELARALRAEQSVALLTIIDGPLAGNQLLVPSTGPSVGSLCDAELDALAVAPARVALERGESRRIVLELGERRLDAFVDVHAPRPRLVVVGAVHVAIPLVALARQLGFRTQVIDPRSAFIGGDRFAHADERIADWPDEALARVGLDAACYVAVLAHDLKLELPALLAALRSPAPYIGVLGSTKTHAKRVAALRESGVSESQLARLHAPIGLDLGGRRPEEIALSIAAEIVAVRHGRGARGAESRAEL